MNDDLFAVVAGLVALWVIGKAVQQPDRPKKPRRVTVHTTPAKYIPFINLHDQHGVPQ